MAARMRVSSLSAFWIAMCCIMACCEAASATAAYVDVPVPVPVVANAPAAADAASTVEAAAMSNGVTISMFSSQKVWYSGWFKSLNRAVKVATILPQMSILLEAVRAADVAAPLSASKTSWTILAPTNAAFEQLLDELNITAEQLLADKPLLIKVLSYHVIPGAAATSAQLETNQNYPTALQGASVKVVKTRMGNVRMVGAGNTAKFASVIAPNIRAGKSVIHVIDQVLLPQL